MRLLKNKVPAVHTLEMALLIPFIFGVIFLLLGLTIIFHNRVVTEGLLLQSLYGNQSSWESSSLLQNALTSRCPGYSSGQAIVASTLLGRNAYISAPSLYSAFPFHRILFAGRFSDDHLKGSVLDINYPLTLRGLTLLKKGLSS